MAKLDKNNNRIREKKVRVNHLAAKRPSEILDPEHVSNEKVIVDFLKLRRYCQNWATLKEASWMMNQSEDAIQRRINEEFGLTFGQFRDLCIAEAKQELIDAQRQKATIEGDSKMQIWLGQQHGQSAKIEKRVEDVTPNKGKQELLDQLGKIILNS